MPAAGVAEGVAEHAASASYEGGQPEISVVVSTRCRSEFLGGLIGALAAQEIDRARFEVVLVDNGSPDDTWEVMKTEVAATGLRMLCLRLSSDRGAGGGRTAGIASARGAVVAFTDDDCLPQPGWLESLTVPLRSADGQPPPVIVQGRTTPWSEDAEGAGPWARTVWVLGPTWLFETCNIAYRRSDLESVGGFAGTAEAPTSHTGRPAGEDALLGWRVVEEGSTLVFQPDALVHHRNFPASFADHLREQRGRAVFPELAARSPYARRALWGRWFLTRRTAGAALALSCVALAIVTRRPRLLAGTVPWVVMALPEAGARRGRHPLVRLGQLAVVDTVGLAATARASLRHKSLVL